MHTQDALARRGRRIGGLRTQRPQGCALQRRDTQATVKRPTGDPGRQRQSFGSRHGRPVASERPSSDARRLPCRGVTEFGERRRRAGRGSGRLQRPVGRCATLPARATAPTRCSSRVPPPSAWTKAEAATARLVARGASDEESADALRGAIDSTPDHAPGGARRRGRTVRRRAVAARDGSAARMSAPASWFRPPDLSQRTVAY
jgi:hypothetical protein